MSDIQRQIDNLKKQNEGMELSFAKNNVTYEKRCLDDILNYRLKLMNSDEIYEWLKEYNEQLKQVSKYLKDKQRQEKEKELKEKKENELKEKEQKQINVVVPKPKTEEALDEEDELTKEEKISYPTIFNMEEAKRAFFSHDTDTFTNIIEQQLTCDSSVKLYKGIYKWQDEYVGRPEFVARNLLRGFVQNLDHLRKYLMVCFRCSIVDKDTKTYNYESFWIVNTTVNLSVLLGSIYDDFDFTEFNELTNMYNKKDIDDTVIGEAYLH